VKVKELKNTYEDATDLKVAVRALAKTFFVKDEILVSHYMISPLVRSQNEKKYKDLGKRFVVHRMNRPRFNIGNFKIEFDIDPRDFMLKIMRHQRWIRKVFPFWHFGERKISKIIHDKLLSGKLSTEELNKIDNIKGYREVRYAKARAL
jgi:indolepyruvate ferredoxin oxidoreductase